MVHGGIRELEQLSHSKSVLTSVILVLSAGKLETGKFFLLLMDSEIINGVRIHKYISFLSE